MALPFTSTSCGCPVTVCAYSNAILLMPQTTPKSLSYGFHILNYGAAVGPNDSHCMITRNNL
jgi:hypothetical protein